MVGTENSRSVNTVLSRILSRSNQYLNSRPKATCSPSSTPGRVYIDLPDPPPLLPALVAAGARLDVAQAMQAAYHQRACDFREQAMATISRACSKLAQIPSTCSHTPDETMIAAFQQIYLKKLNSWISEGVALLQEKGPSVLRCREDDGGVPAKTSKTFNHQYTPLLEHFFEENPFPTHADKVFLAKKSGMTYRQIHVWFQNRRNRTKKALPKKRIREGATLSFDTVIRKSGRPAVQLTTKSDAPFSDQSASISPPVEVYDAFEGVAPPHAFPTTYPPSCEYEPFPNIPTFATPEWPRSLIPSSAKPCQRVVDVDELTEKFSQLNVWDDSLSRSRRKANTCDGSAATSAITVKPSSAPHPACLRPTVVSPLPQMTLKVIPVPASSLHVFRSPSPGSQMATLVPTLAHRRKISPLPKRTPSKLPVFSSDQEISRSSSSPSSRAISSRSSSLGSESMQWFPHNLSNSSSTVTTPETSPSPLSHLT